MNHDRHQHGQTQPKPGNARHHEHKQQLERNLSDPHSNHNGHGKQPNHAQHAGHDKHAGHSPEIFKRRFFIASC